MWPRCGTGWRATSAAAPATRRSSRRCSTRPTRCGARDEAGAPRRRDVRPARGRGRRSEEHTSELQSRFDLVCRLLLEKKKDKFHVQYWSIGTNEFFYFAKSPLPS